jgi:hypothetical protein
VSGTVTIEEAAPGVTRQRFRGTVSVGIPTVGSLVEGIVLNRIYRSYTEMPAVFDDWMQNRDAAYRAQRHADMAAVFAPAAALQAAGRELQRLCAAVALSAATMSEPLRLRLVPP